jgi:hypothetical protein
VLEYLEHAVMQSGIVRLHKLSQKMQEAGGGPAVARVLVCLKTKNIFRTCVCPATLSLSGSWRRILPRGRALAAVASVLCGRGQEWIASRRRIRVGREGNMQWLLGLRGRWVAGVRWWCRLVVRITDHMAIWWALEWRWSWLTGVHGGSGASEEQCEGGAGVSDGAGAGSVEAGTLMCDAARRVHSPGKAEAEEACSTSSARKESDRICTDGSCGLIPAAPRCPDLAGVTPGMESVRRALCSAVTSQPGPNAHDRNHYWTAARMQRALCMLAGRYSRTGPM